MDAPLPLVEGTRVTPPVGSPVSVEAGTGEERLDLLDGLRAVAILMVALFHYTVRWVPPLDQSQGWPGGHLPAAAPLAAWPWLYGGWVGVELFFFISGFVILLTMERCQGVADFVARRFARLWPPMLVAATVTTLAVHAVGPADWRRGALSWLASVTFVSPSLVSSLLHRPGLDWIDGVYWTLWVEVRFYAWMALLYLLSPRRLVAVLVALEVVGALAFHLTTGAAHRLADLLLFPQYLPYFVFGACGYLAFTGRATRGVGLAMAVSAGLFLAQAGLDADLNMDRPWAALGAHVLVLALFAGFLLRARPMALFASPALVAVGRASYSFYLLHQLLGVMALAALTGAGLWLGAAIPLVIAAVLLAAFAMYAWVEQPAKRFVHRHTRAAVRLVGLRAPWSLYRHLPPAPARGPSQRLA